MRLHRFFVSEAIGKQSSIRVNSSELVNQVRRVFRLKKGDRVLLFDGSGSDYESEIVDSTDKAITFNVSSVSRSRYVAPRKIYLCAAIVKKDNFEFIAEKATELGVTDIIPVIAERSEKKALNESRLKKIALEASEQSGRGDIPTIHGIQALNQCIEYLNTNEIYSIAFHTEGEQFRHKDIRGEEPLAIFIGSEGGWSPSELDMFHKNDIDIVCLGSQVLRAETAVISALSGVVFEN